MKAKDLMIGDWVFTRGRIEQVTSIYDGYICTEHYEDSHDYYFEPIPLTPEILEKNSDGGFFYHDSPIIGYDGKRSTCHIGRASLYVEWERISPRLWRLIRMLIFLLTISNIVMATRFALSS